MGLWRLPIRAPRAVETTKHSPACRRNQGDAKGRARSLLCLSTGVDAPYEPPQPPALRVCGHGEEPEAIAERLAELLELGRS